MKLLLTSNGLSNQAIANALFELVGKKPADTSLVFIPTAANPVIGDKDWFINDLMNLQKQDFKSIDIADISALDRTIWLEKMNAADVIFFEGGDNYYLMEWVNKSGLVDIIPELLKIKVYVGLSAGSMIAGKDLNLSSSQLIYGDDLDRTEDLDGLKLVDFYFFPHLNSSSFPHVRKEFLADFAKHYSGKIYAMDDQSALKIVDGKLEVISEGEWLEFNG